MPSAYSMTGFDLEALIDINGFNVMDIGYYFYGSELYLIYQSITHLKITPTISTQSEHTV